jgi:LmbE family N-acetylglucosaminyl deacetylase
MDREAPLMGTVHDRWRAFPVGTVDEVTGGGTSLILAPHPDDESLGCGGLIAACCAAGRPPAVAILTDGSFSHPGSKLFPPPKLAALRAEEAVKAVACLGLPPERLVFLGERDGDAPHSGPGFDSAVERIADCAARFACATLLSTWRGDPHADHRAAALIGQAAARRAGLHERAYPVWGWTLPPDAPCDALAMRGWRLDISAHLPAKRRAIAAHASQYGGIITDDPAGFRLPSALLRAFDSSWETFLLA